MMVGRVSELFRYPVKSMGGEPLDRVEVSARGLAGDRAWATRTADGLLGSGKTMARFRRVDGLLGLTARVTPAGTVIDFPDGTALVAGDPATAARLTAELGQLLTLHPEGTEPYYDDSPVHLVTTASVRRLAELAGGPVDVRRLRPNLVVDVDGTGFAEDDWRGKQLEVGGQVVLRLGDGMPRCVMVNAAQPGLDRDPRMLRALAAEHDLELGLQVIVERGGTIAVGDPVRLG